MITREEILKGVSCPPELEANLQQLLSALNKLRTAYGKPMIVTSGYRNPEKNRKVGGAVNSAHLYCQAADFRDDNHELRTFLLGNLSLLETCGLYLEDPSATPTWIHLQTRKANKRVFKP